MSDAAASAELVRRYYDAFNAGQWDGMLALLTEDVRHDVNEGAPQGGKAKFEAFLAHMDHCYSEQLTDIVVMTSPDGRRAAAEFVVNGTYKATDGDFLAATGQTYRLPAGAFLEIEGERISRVTTYYNLQEWLRQVS